jgi:hypothetical protein
MEKMTSENDYHKRFAAMNSGLQWIEDYNTICDATKMLFKPKI